MKALPIFVLSIVTVAVEYFPFWTQPKYWLPSATAQAYGVIENMNYALKRSFFVV